MHRPAILTFWLCAMTAAAGTIRADDTPEKAPENVEKKGEKKVEKKKVTICHRPPGNPANAHTISVGEPATAAHLKHGDYLGACITGCDAPPCDHRGHPKPSDGKR